MFCEQCHKHYAYGRQSPFCPHAVRPAPIAKPRKQRYEKRRAVLKDWGLLDKGGDGLRLRLVGQVFGHDSFDQGRYIETSPLLRLDMPERTAETLNTVYLLG